MLVDGSSKKSDSNLDAPLDAPVKDTVSFRDDLRKAFARYEEFDSKSEALVKRRDAEIRQTNIKYPRSKSRRRNRMGQVSQDLGRPQV